jgi:hypothetical protein
MSTKSRDENGYLRVTNADGTRSYLYEPPKGFLEGIFIGHGSCIEVADHHKDGTTTAYEYDPGLFDDRSKRK